MSFTFTEKRYFRQQLKLLELLGDHYELDIPPKEREKIIQEILNREHKENRLNNPNITHIFEEVVSEYKEDLEKRKANVKPSKKE